jgi:hypothetical protein
LDDLLPSQWQRIGAIGALSESDLGDWNRRMGECNAKVHRPTKEERDMRAFTLTILIISLMILIKHLLFN